MNVCVIGADYVGLTTSAVLADFGHKVFCVDYDNEKIKRLLDGKSSIYEPGLESLILKNTERGTLKFTTNFKEAVKKSTIVFITVTTERGMDKSTNLTFYLDVAKDLIPLIDSYKVILTKCTVPIGTNEQMINMFEEGGLGREYFDVVSNPEFVREGTAIADMLHPDKIVLGVDNPKPITILQKLYQKIDAPMIITNLNGAEMIKYASNAFLAVKLAFINELAQISDSYKVDINDVALGLGTDPRIGPHLLQAGLGYGGSCLPLDLASLGNQSLERGTPPYLLQAAQKINDRLVDVYLDKLKELQQIKSTKITVWGAAFNPNSDDNSHSPAMKLIERLVEEGAEVHVYDPVVTHIKSATLHDDLYKSVEHASALIIATDLPHFLQADWNQVTNRMAGDLLLDCRNCLSPRVIKHHGLTYIGVARS